MHFLRIRPLLVMTRSWPSARSSSCTAPGLNGQPVSATSSPSGRTSATTSTSAGKAPPANAARAAASAAERSHAGASSAAGQKQAGGSGGTQVREGRSEARRPRPNDVDPAAGDHDDHGPAAKNGLVIGIESSGSPRRAGRHPGGVVGQLEVDRRHLDSPRSRLGLHLLCRRRYLRLESARPGGGLRPCRRDEHGYGHHGHAVLGRSGRRSGERCGSAGRPGRLRAVRRRGGTALHAAGVQDFEIWNEPNDTDFWQPAPQPGCLRTRSSRLRTPTLRPSTPVQSSSLEGLAPEATQDGNINEVSFLQDMYTDRGQGIPHSSATTPTAIRPSLTPTRIGRAGHRWTQPSLARERPGRQRGRRQADLDHRGGTRPTGGPDSVGTTARPGPHAGHSQCQGVAPGSAPSTSTPTRTAAATPPTDEDWFGLPQCRRQRQAGVVRRRRRHRLTSLVPHHIDPPAIRAPVRRGHLSSAVTQPVYDFSERVVVVTGGSVGSGRGSWRRSPRQGRTSLLGTPRGLGRRRRVRRGRHPEAARRRAGHRQGGRALRPPRRADQQRRRLAPRAGGRRLAAFRRGHREPQPAGSAVVRPVGSQGDGRPGGRRGNRERVQRVGHAPVAGASAYGAAKAGLINLTDAGGRVGARGPVNCVTAGLLDTGAGDDFYGGPEGMERAAATVPLGAWARRPTWRRPACTSRASRLLRDRRQPGGARRRGAPAVPGGCGRRRRAARPACPPGRLRRPRDSPVD